VDIQADVFYNGALIASRIPIADGSVTLDRGSKVRRSLSLTVADVSYLPWNPTDPLAVYGQQIVVQSGIRLNGAVEYVPLGTFRIDEPQGDTLTGPVSLTGKSSESTLQDDPFTTPTSTLGMGGCFDAIKLLIHQTLPNVTIVNSTHDTRNPRVAVATWDAQSDRWDAITQVATAMQAEIYVDAFDRFVVADIPNVLSASVVWDVAEGEGGTLFTAARQMSRANVFNAVVASGENTATATAPISATARDNDPTSPTRWGGPYGKVTKFYSSSLLDSVGSCEAAANSMLFDAIAPNITTTITASPNPALEAGDCVRVSYARRKELFLVQAVTIPLSVDSGSSALTLLSGKADTT
jgi:hypothetical protein